jgi:hypothetical protein
VVADEGADVGPKQLRFISILTNSSRTQWQAPSAGEPPLFESGAATLTDAGGRGGDGDAAG